MIPCESRQQHEAWQHALDAGSVAHAGIPRCVPVHASAWNYWPLGALAVLAWAAMVWWWIRRRGSLEP